MSTVQLFGASMAISHNIRSGIWRIGNTYIARTPNKSFQPHSITTWMNSKYNIVRAELHHLPSLKTIELAAAQMLCGHAPESVLAETTSAEQLLRVQQQGTLWVALFDGSPVGFAHVEVFDFRHAHLEELDVLPEHGRLGVGTALVRTVIDWARDSEFCDVTLSTFREVPWNMPFYSKVGFVVLKADELSERLVALVRNEAGRGLDTSARVVMRYQISE